MVFLVARKQKESKPMNVNETVTVVRVAGKRKRNFWIGRVGTVERITADGTYRVEFPIQKGDPNFNSKLTSICELFTAEWLKPAT